jgi:DNA-binding phage protein
MRKSDMEVDEILDFISSELNRIKAEDFGDLSKFAKEAGLTPKNMSDFSNKYGPGSNPQFRTVYKILKALLGRKPINLSKTDPVKELKQIENNLNMLRKSLAENNLL